MTEPPFLIRVRRVALLVAGAFVVSSGLSGAVAQEPPPTPGERVRLEVGLQVSRPLGIVSPLEGTLVMLREGNLVTSTSLYGSVALPLDGINRMYVERDRGTGYAVMRGAVAGTVFGFGMFGFLRMLCGLSSCGSGTGNAWIASAGSGVLVGGLVASQGPGSHWVQVAVPVEAPPTFLFR